MMLRSALRSAALGSNSAQCAAPAIPVSHRASVLRRCGHLPRSSARPSATVCPLGTAPKVCGAEGHGSLEGPCQEAATGECGGPDHWPKTFNHRNAVLLQASLAIPSLQTFKCHCVPSVLGT